jgi:sec-independent protein translocase protein TatA
MFGLGTTEIIIVLVVVLVLFGSRRIPELGKGLAEGIKNFKKGIQDGNSTDVKQKSDDDHDSA